MKLLKKIFKALLLTLCVLLLVFLVIGAILFNKYNQWYKNTFNIGTADSTNTPTSTATFSPAFTTAPNVFCFSNLADGEEQDIEDKIMKFILSDSRTDFVVFSPQETLYILSSNIETTEPFEIKDVCLVPSAGLWQIYLRYSTGSFNLPWIVMDVVKDNRETAEIYVNEIRIGDIEIPEIFVKKSMVEINKGISDAVIMLNENKFLGRTIENIELLDERVVFKGSK